MMPAPIPIRLRSTAPAFAIEKGVPAPRTRPHPKYPFRQMEVGDSFFYAGGTAQQLRAASNYYRIRYGLRFVARAAVADGAYGARCWRVA